MFEKNNNQKPIICHTKVRKILIMFSSSFVHVHCSDVSNCLHLDELQPARLLCPWDFPDKNTGVSCHFLLQGTFLTQGSNLRLLCLLQWQADSLPLNHQGSSYLTPINKCFQINQNISEATIISQITEEYLSYLFRYEPTPDKLVF